MFLSMLMVVLAGMIRLLFDRIIVTANAPEIPNNLVEQLAENGIMVIPIGDDYSQQILKKDSEETK